MPDLAAVNVALRCVAAATALGLLAGAAAGADCAATHPPARVIEMLAAPRYQSCDAVRLDYAGQLAEQVRLLGVLRPAYRRKLEQGHGAAASGASAAGAAAQTRLRQYDAGSSQLLELATAWQQLIWAAEAASIPATGKPLARRWLKSGRVLGQTLSDRVVLGVDALQADEVAPYCKLDFSFRLGQGLHDKLAACLDGL